MSRGSVLGNTTCSKGHTHPPWNTTGLLRIAKCESVCGFCQKETKTAANLKKHVGTHIKNEPLNLSIAEGSSGRGRLEMPTPPKRSLSSQVSNADDERVTETEALTPCHSLATIARGRYSSSFDPALFPSAALLDSKQSQAHSTPYPRAATSSPTEYALSPQPSPRSIMSLSTSQPQSSSSSPCTGCHYEDMIQYHNMSPTNHEWTRKHFPDDLYKHLRDYNIRTKHAWTVIQASEGFRVLDICKSMSTAEGKVPCYNRETLFDEEWQAHMKDVHGVFLIWPETWVRRIEVLDLDAFGNDIVAVNDVVMES